MLMKGKNKATVDFCAMALLLTAIITGMILHRQVNHLFIYNNIFLWTTHEIVGLLLLADLIAHSVQHGKWFTNYEKIPVSRKRVTTILIIVGALLMISGLILMFGSHSHFISILHYVCGIIFTILAIGHVAKRLKILRSLMK
ncbi:MAG: hypothetical protein K2H39_00850 [Paramuribaculum sp.]|nr:hypothetical protein [Paramuribaculum sp.]